MARRHARSLLATTLAASLLCAACGARSGLDRMRGEDDAAISPDASPGDAASRDARAMDAPTLDAPASDARPLSCRGAPLVSPGRSRRVDAPALALSAGVIDPVADRMLVVGGYSSTQAFATSVFSVALGTGAVDALTLAGDPVELPVEATAIWDDANGRAIVLGGTVSSAPGGASAQVFALTVSGATAVARRLADYPAGPVTELSAVYDPPGRRIVATGGGGDPARAHDLRATYALDLTPGAESWSLLVPADKSPPSTSGGGAGFDPLHRRMVIFGGTRTDGVPSPGNPVHVLALDTPFCTGPCGSWETLPGDASLDPSTLPPNLTWDDASCGFLFVSDRTSRCSPELWLLTLDPTVTMTGLGALDVAMPAGWIPATAFDRSRDHFVLSGGYDCMSRGLDTLGSVDFVPLTR